MNKYDSNRRPTHCISFVSRVLRCPVYGNGKVNISCLFMWSKPLDVTGRLANVKCQATVCVSRVRVVCEEEGIVLCMCDWRKHIFDLPSSASQKTGRHGLVHVSCPHKFSSHILKTNVLIFQNYFDIFDFRYRTFSRKRMSLLVFPLYCLASCKLF